jgi:hypothetical protein
VVKYVPLNQNALRESRAEGGGARVEYDSRGCCKDAFCHPITFQTKDAKVL